MGTKQRDQDQELLLILSAWLEIPQPGIFTALESICPCVINYTASYLTSSCAGVCTGVHVGAGQGPSSLTHPSAELLLLVPSCRAKEIKTKLGTLLQKPDSAIDFIIPYPEKPEKPPKVQK